MRLRINSDSDVCRIRYGCIILSASVISPTRQVLYKSAVDYKMRNANKMSNNLLFRNGEENEQVIRNPHADPDHHQKLIISRRSPLAHVRQV